MSESVPLIDTSVPAMEAHSAHSAKVGKLGVEAVSTMYMLIRNVRVHDPSNAVFERPFASLQQAINTTVSVTGRFNLNAVGTTIYLNEKQLVMDFSSLESVRFLANEFMRKEVGGFSVSRLVQVQELRDFVWIFSRDNNGGVDEDGAAGRPLANIKVGKFARIREQLAKDEQKQLANVNNVDRKKYALTVYARAVYFMRVYLQRLREGATLPPVAKAARIVQELVDICAEQRNHFLGMTLSRSQESYLEFHSVNVCLMAIVFGNELGLTRVQLHELGMAALFHEVGAAHAPKSLLAAPGTLTIHERRAAELFPLHTVRTMLRARTTDTRMLRRMVGAYEGKIDFSLPVRQPDGSTRFTLPKAELGVFGRVIAICAGYDSLTSARPYRDAYGPDVAMMLMFGDLKYKFDPALLKVFMKAMAIAPVKIMDPGTHIEIA